MRRKRECRRSRSVGVLPPPPSPGYGRWSAGATTTQSSILLAVLFDPRPGIASGYNYIGGGRHPIPACIVTNVTLAPTLDGAFKVMRYAAIGTAEAPRVTN
jgi:hypothetical protein